MCYYSVAGAVEYSIITSASNINGGDVENHIYIVSLHRPIKLYHHTINHNYEFTEAQSLTYRGKMHEY